MHHIIPLDEGSVLLEVLLSPLLKEYISSHRILVLLLSWLQYIPTFVFIVMLSMVFLGGRYGSLGSAPELSALQSSLLTDMVVLVCRRACSIHW